MALTLQYSVTSLKVKDEVNKDGVTLENAVCQTYWKVVGTDENGNQAEFQGATPFSAANVAEGNFKAFADLTEEDVIGWIKDVVDGDANYKAHIESVLQKDINKVALKEVTMPWATDVTPPTPEETDPGIA